MCCHHCACSPQPRLTCAKNNQLAVDISTQVRYRLSGLRREISRSSSSSREVEAMLFLIISRAEDGTIDLALT